LSFFFDCRFIRVDNHDGISRFSSELLSSVAKKTRVTALVFDRNQLKQLPNGIDYLMVNDPMNPIAELGIAKKLNAAGASVVFSPMQTMGSLSKKYQLILTLHDLIYYKHRKPPVFLSWPIRAVWRLFHLSFAPVRVLLNRADAVVTISATTKKLIEANRLTKRPVEVVYNASSMSSLTVPLSEPRSRNLVYMGSFMPYKNVELLVRAMQQLPGFTLTLCSKIESRRRSQLLTGIDQSTISRINFVDGVSESEYQKILDECFALVSASRDEGFGIPVIEAMSRSIPVVLSDIPIFREVSGGAGLFFDPNSVTEFLEAIRDLESIEKWQQSSQLSLNRSMDFSWNQSADKLLALVEDLRG